MRKFTTITSIAAPLDEANIDTDIIFPARFLLIMDKLGLGKYAFNERRNTGIQGSKFVLDTPPYTGSEILVTGARFGIGSSREQAVWALTDLGIRCIIAPSFGDIFYANCLNNGLLPIELSGAQYELIMNSANEAATITVDLKAQTLTISQSVVKFDVPQRGKYMLLNGLDTTGEILANETEAIEAFERQQCANMPWLYLNTT